MLYKMLWLLYGANGWIGSQLVEILEKLGEDVVKGKSRVDNFEETNQEIMRINPDRVICTTGRTSGLGHPNIDYLELPGKLTENLRDNLHGPLNLATICGKLGKHLTYMGTGCIFEYDENHPMDDWKGHGFKENDLPNFAGSQYSAVKGITDQLIGKMPMVLNVRIRMPISNQNNPRNFIIKIAGYKKVISIPNSMTVFPELLPIMIDLAKNQHIGTINLTNPGVITHAEILDLYKEFVDPEFKYEIMDLNELDKHTVAKRSNNYLETDLLQSLYPNVLPIYDAVRKVMIGGIPPKTPL